MAMVEAKMGRNEFWGRIYEALERVSGIDHIGIDHGITAMASELQVKRDHLFYAKQDRAATYARKVVWCVLSDHYNLDYKEIAIIFGFNKSGVKRVLDDYARMKSDGRLAQDREFITAVDRVVNRVFPDKDKA